MKTLKTDRLSATKQDTHQRHKPHAGSGKTKLDVIDEAALETFPSSDPPAWTLGTNHEKAIAVRAEAKTITQILSYEHHLIRIVLSAINDLIIDIGEGKPVNIKVLLKLCTFLHDFVELCHHQKEELLFSVLKEGENHPSAYLLNDLHKEHESGRKLLSYLEKIAKIYLHHEESDNKKLINLLKDMSNLHLNHIAKEDEYILPVLVKIIDKDTQQIFLTKFEKIDNQFGAKAHDKLIELANQLSVKPRR